MGVARVRAPTPSDLCQPKLHASVTGNRRTIAMECRVHGYVSEREGTLAEGRCLACKTSAPVDAPHVERNVYEGWYRDIDSQPVYIRDKMHLYEECKRRGLAAAALMSGGEMKRPVRGRRS